MPLIQCTECQHQISDRAPACPRCGAPRRAAVGGQVVILQRGFELKAGPTIFGLPLLHIATGFDPKSGRKRVAKGIIAIGDIALGVVAIGGIALGGVCLGGLAVGLLTLAGLSIAAVAFGGVAIGLVLAVGGLALGYAAVGGLAIGFYAIGGAAFGAHTISALSQDPAAVRFFSDYVGQDILKSWTSRPMP